MKKKEWTEGLDHLDPDLVEAYVLQKERLRQRKKAKGVWLRFGAIAASFVLILSAVIFAPMLNGEGPVFVTGTATGPKVTGIPIGPDVPGVVTPPVINDHTPLVFDATISPEKLSGNNLEFVIGTNTTNWVTQPAPPYFKFDYGISVKAKVVENYPDLYYKLDTDQWFRPTAYRLILMEAVEVIIGENVPQYFLYLIPDKLFVDMSVYDSLLISMSQLSVENYVLKNGTRNEIECFDLLVFGDSGDHPDLGNMIAFSNGIFDESLWQNEGWGFGYQFGKSALDHPEHLFYDPVVVRGDSEETVIAAILKQYNEGTSKTVPTVVTLDLKTQAAKDALAYVTPYVNGIFSQTYEQYHEKLIFRRYINGCRTEETVTIDLRTEEVTYSEVRYTEEDLMRMENISVYLAEKAAEYAEQAPTPPRLDTEGKKLIGLSLYAWYAKVDGKIYGIIKTAWCYQENDDYYKRYPDTACVLYDIEAGTATDISVDDLRDIIGQLNM